MFSGLSSLRKEEEKKTSTELTEKQKAMQVRSFLPFRISMS